MYIVLFIIKIIVCVILVLGFSFIGAIIVYLTEEEKYDSEDKGNDGTD